MSSTPHAAFPLVETLWRGAILGCIAEAVIHARNDSSFIDRSWAGGMYIKDNYQGQRVVVNFTPGGVLGLCFDRDSDRNPYPPGVAPGVLPSFLVALPPTLYPLYDETAPFTRIEDLPVYTAAFWSESNQFTAAEPWPSVLANGAALLADEFLPPEAALARWSAMPMSFVSRRLHPTILALYQRRIVARDATVEATAAERDAIFTRGHGDHDLARDLFADLGITFPTRPPRFRRPTLPTAE